MEGAEREHPPGAEPHAGRETADGQRARLLARLRVERQRAAEAHAPTYPVIHKGYIAAVAHDPDAGVYRARAVGLVRDEIAAEGATAHDAAMRFWRAVDDYLGECAARGRAPERPPG
jgi:hypothetical protein